MKVSGQLHAATASHPEKEPRYNWVGDRVGPSVGLDIAARIKVIPYLESNPGH
jgi:hypothetical protein